MHPPPFVLSRTPTPLQSLSFRFRDQTKPTASSPSPRAREADRPLSPAQKPGAPQRQVHMPADPPSLEPPCCLPPFRLSLLISEHDCGHATPWYRDILVGPSSWYPRAFHYRSAIALNNISGLCPCAVSPTRSLTLPVHCVAVSCSSNSHVEHMPRSCDVLSDTSTLNDIPASEHPR